MQFGGYQLVAFRVKQISKFVRFVVGTSNLRVISELCIRLNYALCHDSDFEFHNL